MGNCLRQQSASRCLFAVISPLLLVSPAFSQSLHASQAASALQSSVNEECLLHVNWWSSLPKEKKALYANATAVSFITLYGFVGWDYGSADFFSQMKAGLKKIQNTAARTKPVIFGRHTPSLMR